MVQRPAFGCVLKAVLSLLHGQEATHFELQTKSTVSSISSSPQPL
jgi:hypothetical protein